MDNIFENAYFGKAYKTRSGKKAIYIEHLKDNETDKHKLISEPYYSMNWYDLNGKVNEYVSDDCEFNIVSEWQTEIDENELDKLAYEYDANSPHFLTETVTISHRMQHAFKAGYCKAKEE